MKYHIITFGCQMNRSDSERIAALLEKIGFSFTPNENTADLIIINVCSVRQSAVDRVYGKIGKLAKLRNKGVKILLTGCILKEDKEKLKNKVDLIFEIKNLNKLPELLQKTLPEKIENYLEIPPKYSTYPIAYLPIMTGCNNFCTYCVVPYTRGREISRPVKEILQEVKELVKKGYKEIILLGQNVNSYKSKINSKKINFPKLLQIINKIAGEFWLTFVTSHPKDLSDELIETMRKSEKIIPYLHLPVQSGDNKILKKMNRHYTVGYYKNLIRKIRAKIPMINISTDIIVGFPGETKKQFENTVKLMKEIKFDMAYIAKYSPRPGTVAAKLKDDVPMKEKERRWKILTKILEKTALESNKKYLNQIIEVLIIKKRKDCFLGQSKNFKNVKILDSKFEHDLVGKFVKVKIKKAIPWGLEGEIVK